MSTSTESEAKTDEQLFLDIIGMDPGDFAVAIRPRFEKYPHVALEDFRSGHLTGMERKKALEILGDEIIFLWMYNALIPHIRDGWSVEVAKRDRWALKARIAVWGRWTAPIRQLPTEIIEMIAYLVCMEPFDNEDMPGFALIIGTLDGGVHAPALTLGRVCYRWRDIVHSSPRLWASFHLNTTKITPTTRAIFDLYVERSARRSRLERLALEDDTYEDLSGDSTHTEVLQHLSESLEDAMHVLKVSIEQMDRAVELTLRIHPIILAGIPLSPELSFSHLRTLNDYTVADAFTEENPSLWEYIARASELDRVEVSNLTSIYAIILSFETLTSLSIFESVCVETLLSVLPRCERLVDLHVGGLNQYVYPLGASDRTTLPTLLCFHIDTPSSLDILTGFLSFLRLPSLNQLFVVSSYDPSQDAIERAGAGHGVLPAWAGSLIAFLEASSSQLMTLTLDVKFSPSDLSVHTVPEILRVCPHLLSFDFKVSGTLLEEQKAPRFTVELLNRLIPNHKSPPSTLVPQLAKLHIREPLSFMSEATLKLINVFGESRCRISFKERELRCFAMPLQSLLLEFSDFSAEPFDKRWEQADNLKGPLFTEVLDGTNFSPRRVRIRAEVEDDLDEPASSDDEDEDKPSMEKREGRVGDGMAGKF
ncbi:hypothetical protein V5O48_011043 [Marasmius crinis-equi]|uniref:F-box domain-containing protein n=1 Tax=Marasmius crinis-equi TaxID=585013 RepID=A0ABR3F6P8_9AGAR